METRDLGADSIGGLVPNLLLQSLYRALSIKTISRLEDFNASMATPTIFCESCKRLLREISHELLQPGRRFKRGNHHENFVSFREAVELECFICKLLWEIMDDNTRDRLAEDPDQERDNTKYNFNNSELKDDTSTLFIWHVDLERESITKLQLIIVSATILRPSPSSPAEIAPSTSCSSTLDLAYQWFNSCCKNHEKCDQLVKSPKWCPTRLLDIGVTGDAEWRLRITSEDIPEPPDYLTLSHRWAKYPRIKLTRPVLEEFHLGKPISILPQTFQDAIIVARWFSVRYLWIDSLCIMQDSDEDWQKESAMMRDVYANSLCNLASAASVCPEDGLFRTRSPTDILPGMLRAKFDGTMEQDYYIFDTSYGTRQITSTELHQRGWVFQERLLAPRVLHFTEKQIFWECFEGHKCEGFPDGIPYHSSLKDLNALFEKSDGTHQRNGVSVKVFHLWYRLVTAYSRCELTRPNDKMVALSGLARIFQDATGDQYLAGLWRSCLIESLYWRPYEIAKRPLSYRAPSWSWAAIDGRLHFEMLMEDDIELAVIIDAHVITSALDATGLVSDGYIVIEGVVVPATFYGTRTKLEFSHIDRENVLQETEAFLDAPLLEFENEIQLYCLTLKYSPQRGTIRDSKAGGLLLALVPESVNTYTRVGIFTVDSSDFEMFGLTIEGDRAILQEPIELTRIKIV